MYLIYLIERPYVSHGTKRIHRCISDISDRAALCLSWDEEDS